MIFLLETTIQLELECEPGATKSKLHNTSIIFETKPNDLGFSDNGAVTEQGAKALTQTLVQGLVTHIHHCHQSHYWDSADHLRYIIAELERGFAQCCTVKQDYFTKLKDQ